MEQEPGAGPPRGWYRDPSGSNRLRYWDGTRWTSLTADTEGRETRRSRSRRRFFVDVVVIVLALAVAAGGGFAFWWYTVRDDWSDPERLHERAREVLPDREDVPGDWLHVSVPDDEVAAELDDGGLAGLLALVPAGDACDTHRESARAVLTDAAADGRYDPTTGEGFGAAIVRAGPADAIGGAASGDQAPEVLRASAVTLRDRDLAVEVFEAIDSGGLATCLLETGVATIADDLGVAPGAVGVGPLGARPLGDHVVGVEVDVDAAGGRYLWARTGRTVLRVLVVAAPERTPPILDALADRL